MNELSDKAPDWWKTKKKLMKCHSKKIRTKIRFIMNENNGFPKPMYMNISLTTTVLPVFPF
jgi:hypothetical protein